MKTIKLTVWFIMFMIFSITAISQETANKAISHLKVKRLNDSYIDVYHNKPIKDKIPILILR